MAEHQTEAKLHRTLLYRADRLAARFIPSFNIRAILYLTVLFALALFLQQLRIATPTQGNTQTLPVATSHEQSD